MKQISETSFAARLSRAATFKTTLASFADYAPGEQHLTAESLQLLIDNLTVTQSKLTLTKHAFSEAVKDRKAIFVKEPNSIAKTATRTKAYIRAKYKKDSQEFQSIDKLVSKIRGQKPIVINNSSTEETISRSERSYGAQVQNFSDIITLITEFGASYTPANESIQIENLQILLTQATTLNQNTTLKFVAYKPKINERMDGFAELANRISDIKDMVLSQYGFGSEQHKLIKSFRFGK